jgi:hypothetical protein
MDAFEQSKEKLLASSVRYLTEGDEKDAAMLLISARIEDYYFNERDDTWYVELRGSRKLYDGMWESYEEPRSDIGQRIYYAIKACLPIHKGKEGFLTIHTRMQSIDVDLDWRAKLLAEVDTKSALNQNSYEKSRLLWKACALALSQKYVLLGR